MTRTLVTGGAGFVGTHVVRELLAAGDSVRVLDSLVAAGDPVRERADSLRGDVELQVGDVRDPEAVRRALRGVDRVVHLAARVGVGQSMYEVTEFTSVNVLGTAVLLQALLDRPVERLVVGSSMCVYGEGLYVDATGAAVTDARRNGGQLRGPRWDPTGTDGAPLVPVPTPEWKPPGFATVYAHNKFDQEQLCLLFGAAHHVDVVALRFFNVYGTAPRGRASGVLSGFVQRLLDGRGPVLFEDGEQRRDFVHVRDVARACRLALDAVAAPGHVVNVGSGHSARIRDVAVRLGELLERPMRPEVTGCYRAGDVRHCFADVEAARRLLGFESEVSLDDGLVELAAGSPARPRAIAPIPLGTEELVVRGSAA